MLVIAIIAIVLYAFSGIVWLRAWPLKTQALLSGCAAITLHALLTISHSYGAGSINFSFVSVSNIISVCITLISLGISLYLPIHKLVAPLFLLAAINIVMSLFGGGSTITPLSPSIATHVLPSIIAYSLFSLKQHKLTAIIPDLPPIDIMERMLISIILIAYILLSASIISGFITIDDFLGQKLAHKTVFSILAWCTYSILLYGHFATGWRGTLAIKWTIGGFVFLMLGFFGTKLVLEMML